ncbi:hypothetical protein OY671_008342, partial [Metschnikowia pulcherrima]
ATSNGNLYWNDIRAHQAAQIDSSRPTLGNFLGNAARVRSRGVEIEGEAKSGGGFSASLNASFNDAPYRSYTNAPAPLEFRNVVSTVDSSGKRVIGSSKWSGQASLNYDAPISGRVALTVYLNQTYRSATNSLNPISAYGYQGAYGSTNGGIGSHGTDGRYSSSFWARNIFDKRYAVGIGAANSVSPFVKVLGDPRTFGATLKGKF